MHMILLFTSSWIHGTTRHISEEVYTFLSWSLFMFLGPFGTHYSNGAQPCIFLVAWRRHYLIDFRCLFRGNWQCRGNFLHCHIRALFLTHRWLVEWSSTNNPRLVIELAMPWLPP